MEGVLVLLCCSLVVQHWSFVQAYENLALNKSTWQKNPYLAEPWGSDRAVDGRFANLSQHGGQCAVSFNAVTAEWGVDLGGVSNIHHVTIHFAQGMNRWGENNELTAVSLGFSVYVSNTTDRESGILCFKDTKYTRATIPNPVSVPCPFRGRYVFYYNNRTHPPYPPGYSPDVASDLCEVQVYGSASGSVSKASIDISQHRDRRNQHYAVSEIMPCAVMLIQTLIPTKRRMKPPPPLKCPQNCQEGHCDIVNGTCLACVVGFQGQTCQEECTGNTYGLRCKEICGKCKNGDQCDRVTGSCSMGCDSGHHGVKCDKVDDVFSIFSLDNPLAVPFYAVLAVCSISVTVIIILCIKRKARTVESERHTDEPTSRDVRLEQERPDTAYEELEDIGKGNTYELVY